MTKEDRKHWKKVAEKDIKEHRGIFELGMYIGHRIEYCSDRWCDERVYHVELLFKELKKRLKKD